MTRWLILPVLMLSSCDGGGGGGGGSGQTQPPSSVSVWQAGPVIGSKNYSPGTNLEPQGQLFAFNVPVAPGSVHYVTKRASLANVTSIHVRWRLEGGPVVGANCTDQTSPSAVTVYFQRQGDSDFSGTGAKEAYRWWATGWTTDLSGPGEYDLTVPLAGPWPLNDEGKPRTWSAVETSNAIANPTSFADAKARVERVGITFRNCTGYGHGAWALAPARFTLLAFDLL